MSKHVCSDAAVAFGKRLRNLREYQGYTRKQISIATGITVRTLQSYEFGWTLPNLHALKQLSKIYKVNLMDFYEL